MAELTHLDEHGNAHMVDVGGKAITDRVAVAEGRIRLGPDALAAVVERRAAKGDVLAIAQLAGIQGAKRTADLIPLCHPLPITSVDVHLEVDGTEVVCRATARATWRTGVEMEAMTAVSAALLTVYDMLKAVDRSMEIGAIRLLEKRGGRSGHWVRGK
jgi:cyclic pyranopterin phosphate synthase